MYFENTPRYPMVTKTWLRSGDRGFPSIRAG
jgi:hypothetical protein